MNMNATLFGQAIAFACFVFFCYRYVWPPIIAAIEEREAIAAVCAVNLQLEMPMLLDGIDNRVDSLYAALPERLYLLDSAGRVAFRTVVGSPGFDVDAFEQAIATHVEGEAAAD